MKILIKYPTRGRRALFEETIKNIQDTISGEHEYSIEVTTDKDDESMHVVNLSADELVNVSFMSGYSLSKIHACNRDMDIITANYDWDILILMSDDMKFVVKGWDKKIVEEFNKTGLDAFQHWNDGYVGDKLPTMSIMGREYYERFFYIYTPCYKSFSCDAEAMFVAQMLGKWHYYSEVIFKHEHPANNPMLAKYDETYHLASKHSQHDIDTYFKRMQKLFYVNNPVTIPSVLKAEMEAKGWL
jgi:hypothetical protein